MTKASSKKARPKQLPWEYCECGCHGHDVRIGSLYYWMFDDLKGSFSVYTGHQRMGDKVGTYSSFAKADRATRTHAKKQIAPALKILGL